mmetsp:Transcript_5021/g.8753  ORF Transcript_5021/g.8753 Transcript_5021/m.8753 type:complete len:89 (+) Transcript_5021:111-377(+)
MPSMSSMSSMSASVCVSVCRVGNPNGVMHQKYSSCCDGKNSQYKAASSCVGERVVTCKPHMPHMQAPRASLMCKSLVTGYKLFGGLIL